jgi:hypothetical protein
MEVVNENVEAKVEAKVEPVEVPVVSVQTPVKPTEKIKKVRTEAQRNQLKKAREKRKENSKKRKLVQEVVTKPMKDDDSESDEEESNKRPKISEPTDGSFMSDFNWRNSSFKYALLGAAGLATAYLRTWPEKSPREEKKDSKEEDVPNVKPPQNNRESKRNDPLAGFLP